MSFPIPPRRKANSSSSSQKKNLSLWKLTAKAWTWIAVVLLFLQLHLPPPPPLRRSGVAAFFFLPCIGQQQASSQCRCRQRMWSAIRTYGGINCPSPCEMRSLRSVTSYCSLPTTAPSSSDWCACVLLYSSFLYSFRLSSPLCSFSSLLFSLSCPFRKPAILYCFGCFSGCW